MQSVLHGQINKISILHGFISYNDGVYSNKIRIRKFSVFIFEINRDFNSKLESVDGIVFKLN